jgi:alkylated DNA repair dioxygenase AlkB
VRLPVQADLFAGDVAVDATFARAVRTPLDAASWVEHVPGWMSGAALVFDELARVVPWKQHRRELYGQWFLEPRLTAEYRDLGDAPQPLRAAAAALSRHYGVRYDSLWLNLYRDGRDSTGWHRDRFSCRRPECVVPVLSLGAPRRFLVKPRQGGASFGWTPRSGDLVVMGGRSQQDFVHGVPKSAGPASARISVNFQSSAQARR